MADNTPPNTLTATSHGIMIKAAGQVIGAIHSWQPAMNRTVTEMYCFGGSGLAGPGVSQASGPGEPFEKVPGNVSGMTIRVDRYDLFTRKMEVAFGTPDLTNLSSQSSSFAVTQILNRPGAVPGVNSSPEVIEYQGCWFSEIGRTFQATDDRVIKTNATLHYTRKVKTSP